MSKKIAEYVNFIFRNAPNTREAMELKEEIENNVSDKYNKLVAGGLDEEQAFSKAIASIGNIDELLDELKHSAEKAAFTDDDKKQGEDNIKQSFSEYRNHYKPKRRLFRKMKSLVWLCAVVVYFLISFSTRRWDITWITFIIAGIGVSILDIGMDED